MSKLTQTQHDALVQLAAAVVSTIKEFGPDGVPSGHLYAALMGCFSNLDSYERMISLLVSTGLVERKSNHILVAKI